MTADVTPINRPRKRRPPQGDDETVSMLPDEIRALIGDSAWDRMNDALHPFGPVDRDSAIVIACHPSSRALARQHAENWRYRTGDSFSIVARHIAAAVEFLVLTNGPDSVVVETMLAVAASAAIMAGPYNRAYAG